LSREWAISNIFSPIFTVQLSEQSPAGACHFVATARTSSSGRWLYDAHRTGSLAGTETGLEASTPSMCWVGAVEICTARNHAHRLRFRWNALSCGNWWRGPAIGSLVGCSRSRKLL